MTPLAPFGLPTNSLPAIRKLAAEHPPERVTHVLYHDQCQDGFGAAYAAWKTLGDQARYVPVNYQQPLPELPKDARVAVVDFSFPPEQMKELKEKVADVVVLDHHKSAAETLQGLDYAVFDMNRAGAGLSWHYFHPQETEPDMLAYVEDRDLWHFALPQSHEVYDALAAYPMDFKLWDQLTHQVDTLKSEGVVLERMAHNQVDQLCAQARMGTIAGYRVPVVNSSLLASEVGAELLKRYPQAPFAAIYADLPSGQRTWELRSREDGVDVSAVARQFGGGGHRAAAGFRQSAAVPIDVEPYGVGSRE